MPPRSLAFPLVLAVLLLTAGPAVGLQGAATPANDDVTDRSLSPALSATGASGPLGSGAADGERRAAMANRSESLEPTDVTMRAGLRSNGDARWSVTATFPIRDANDRDAFEELAEEFEESENPLGLDSFRVFAANASEATDRVMRVENASTSHSTSAETGSLVLSFTWTEFARTDGEVLAVGDAFNTNSGTWLGSLPSGQTLLIAPPSDYGVESAPVGIENGVARWEGPYDFSGREPWIVYSGDPPTRPTTSPPVTASPTPSTAPPTTGSPTPASPGTGPGPGGPLPSAVTILLLVLLAGATATVLAAYVQRDEGDGGLSGLLGSDDDGGSAASASDGDGSATAGAPGSDGAAGSGDAPPGPDAVAADDDVDPELLSDEERVERLLGENGGRMKQATIVKETGWSNAKVSQLLSAMAQEGRVDKLRIGRENLISFPDEDVADVDGE